MDAEFGGNGLEFRRSFKRKLLGLDHTGAGNQENRLIQPGLEAAELHQAATSSERACLVRRSSAALI